MKILLLTEVFPPKKGGSGRWMWECYRRLPRSDVHVMAGEVEGADEFDRTSDMSIERLVLRFSDWGISRPFAAYEYARALLRLRRAVRRDRPGAIHCGKTLPEGLMASVIANWSGVPFYCYAHGEELTLARTSRELTWLTGRVLRRALGIIANSHHSKQILIAEWGISGDKITVLHPGVDTSRFRPAPLNPSVRERLGWNGRRVVLTVGALQKRKGQDMLIRALPAIRQKCPSVLYSMIGDGWEREYLEQLSRELDVADAVQFRGAPNDAELVECYQQCDLFALPNRRVGWDFEGFGIALLEAQACGKAVVAGRSGGTEETMDPSRTGELVPCDGPHDLAAVVSSLLLDEERRAAMGARARDWVVTNFDWEVVGLQGHRIFANGGSCN